MALLELGPVAFGGNEGIISFLMSKGILAKEKKCACGLDMELSERRDVSDGFRWHCPECRKCVSIRKGSFFEKSKITLQKWLLLIHWWAGQYAVSTAADEVGVSEATAVQVYSRLRDVCSHRLCSVDPPIKLGGPGKKVRGN